MAEKKENRQLIRPLGNNDVEYLQDESKFEGIAYSISFPENKQDVQAIIKECEKNHEGITIQGALTGITGAAVPTGGHVMNMKNMNHVLQKPDGISEKESIEAGKTSIKTRDIIVEAGMTFQELENVIRKETNNRYFFPAIPTEKTATIGGAIACGSRGIHSFGYGEIADYIESIEICNSQGEILVMKKSDGEVETFLRSEGMLGVITGATLKLVEKPEHVWGILFMFQEDRIACNFADAIEPMNGITVLEYMDRNTIDLIEEFKANMSSIAEIPSIPDEMKALIYIEVTDLCEDAIEENVSVIIEKCMEAGGDPDLAWAISSETELNVIRSYRHAASECANLVIASSHAKDKRIKKLSADISWRKKSRLEILEYYKEQLEPADLKYCIFGHLGLNQPYLNILASNKEEYETGKELMKQWIRDAYKSGETVFGEHGVGKVKKDYFCELAPIEEINRAVKAKVKWDAKGRFNAKNKFQESML